MSKNTKILLAMAAIVGALFFLLVYSVFRPRTRTVVSSPPTVSSQVGRAPTPTNADCTYATREILKLANESGADPAYFIQDVKSRSWAPGTIGAVFTECVNP